MKTLILFLVLVLSTSVNSQIFGTFDPTTFAVGGIVNANINNQFGLYGGASFTKIKHNGFSSHYDRYSGGVNFRLNEKVRVLVGYTHISVSDPFTTPIDIEKTLDLSNIRPHSFEAGFTAHVYKNMYLLFLTDPINWQTQIGIGININFKNKRE